MTQPQKDLTRQQDILNAFRNGKLSHYDIPVYCEEYGIDGWEDDVGRMFSALQVVCTIEEWCADTSTTMKGVVVQSSSDGIHIGVPEDVLRLLQKGAIKTEAVRGLLRRPAVHDVSEGRIWHPYFIEKHRLTHGSESFTWYNVGCTSIARQEVDLMLQHPLVKPFL